MADESKLDSKLDAACGAVKTFDWGSDAGPLAAIDDACVAGPADTAARAELERRLAAVLAPGASQACKDYVCRKLALIGTAASVPALAPLLAAADDAHLARYALERMTCPEAAAALRTAVETTKGDLQLGAISSLGGRRDEQAVPLLGRLLGADPAVAVAAARALGRIGSAAAARTLAAAKPAAADAMVAGAIADARLACGDAAFRRGQRAEALAIFRSVEADAKGKPAARVAELAAIRGILAALDETTDP
jgi:hypothetical protein